MTTHKKSVVLRVSVAEQYTRHSKSMRSIVASMTKVICFGLLTASINAHQAFAANVNAQLSNQSRSSSVLQDIAIPVIKEQSPLVNHRQKRANFERENASQSARHVADWVVATDDNRSMPFVIVDKINAKVFVFHADGQLRGAASALLGLARGDDAVPGIGNRKLSSIRPEERTTPAGRFVVALDRNLHGEEILWVDYDGAVSMHPVITSNPKERRLQRLATPTPLDNRISYGCINVPAKFFTNVVRPAFAGTNGIVYVLPETRSVSEVFAPYDVEGHTQLELMFNPKLK